MKFNLKKLVENANLKPNKTKNAIPNTTTKIPSKDWNVTKTDVNYENRLALLDGKERVNFLNQQERVKDVKSMIYKNLRYWNNEKIKRNVKEKKLRYW